MTVPSLAVQEHSPGSLYSGIQEPRSTQSTPPPPAGVLRGRPRVLASCLSILSAYLFLYAKFPTALVSWTMAQQAFNSCMILILDALETGDLSRIGKVEKAYVAFVELEKNKMHKLAGLAVERISAGLTELNHMSGRHHAGGKTETPDLHGTRYHHPGEMDAIAGKSKAKRGSGVAQDTVMGNTGMMLLEDTGLQSYAQPAFEPFHWFVDQEDWATTRLTRGKQEQDMRTEKRNLSPPNDRAREARQDRSAEQGAHPGSATTRYPTCDRTPAQEGSQPQGLTPPTSPMSSGTLRQDSYIHFLGSAPALEQVTSRHVGYDSPRPSMRDSVRATFSPHVTTHRRNTFPVLSYQEPMMDAPPALQHNIQARQEATVGHLHRPSQNFDQISWLARPGPPSSSASESALNFPHVSLASHVCTGLEEQFPQVTLGRPHQATYPMQMPLAGSTAEPSATDLAWTTGEEMMLLDNWTGWHRGRQAG
jgi:hypothetical protein